MQRYESTLAAGLKTLRADDEAILQLRQQVARGHYLLGRWQSAASEVKALLDDLEANAKVDARRVGRASLLYGDLLVALARAEEGATYLRAAIDDLSKSLKDTPPRSGGCPQLPGSRPDGHGQLR